MTSTVFELVSAYGTVGLSLGLPSVSSHCVMEVPIILTSSPLGELLPLRRAPSAVQAHRVRRHVAWSPSRLTRRD